MGRDFTIHASVAGWVKYYRDPNLHPRRQYIGVAFERDHVLPRDPTAPRPRRLDMVETPMPPPEVAAQKPTASESPIATATTTAANSTPSSGSLSDIPPSVLRRLEPGERPGTERLLVRGPEGSSGSLAYAYREQNWRIGRLVDTRLRAVMGGKGVTGRVVARRRRAERERERARRRRERAALGVAGVKPEKVLEVKGGKKERAGKRKEKKKAKA